jgi:hypothetical protein
MVDDNFFSIKKGRDGSVEMNIHRFQTLVECEQILFNWLHENNMDIKKVEVLRAIIWLNMSPLHQHPLDIFLYYLGKLQLFQVLNK